MINIDIVKKILPKDIWNICESYLSDNEIIYFENKWINFSKDNICNIAAENGWLDLLMWAYDKGYRVDKWTCTYAALNGHLNILKFIYEKEKNFNMKQMQLCTYAAGNGHLETLKWLRSIGCEWDIYTSYNAAHGGHVEVFKWIYENGCEIDIDACVYASNGKYTEIVEFIDKLDKKN